MQSDEVHVGATLVFDPKNCLGRDEGSRDPRRVTLPAIGVWNCRCVLRGLVCMYTNLSIIRSNCPCHRLTLHTDVFI